jgi:hypothetical protein
LIARTLLADRAGLEFENDASAIAHAESMAEELAGTTLRAGCAILLTDEQDNTIFEVALTTTTSLALLPNAVPVLIR